MNNLFPNNSKLILREGSIRLHQFVVTCSYREITQFGNCIGQFVGYQENDKSNWSKYWNNENDEKSLGFKKVLNLQIINHGGSHKIVRIFSGIIVILFERSFRFPDIWPWIMENRFLQFRPVKMVLHCTIIFYWTVIPYRSILRDYRYPDMRLRYNGF